MKSVKSCLDIPNHTCGVYILHLERHGTYIGSSWNIRRRIITHVKNMIYKIIYIDYYKTDSRKEAFKLESELIKKLKPESNGDRKRKLLNRLAIKPIKQFTYSRIIKPKKDITFIKKKFVLKRMDRLS